MKKFICILQLFVVLQHITNIICENTLLKVKNTKHENYSGKIRMMLELLDANSIKKLGNMFKKEVDFFLNVDDNTLINIPNNQIKICFISNNITTILRYLRDERKNQDEKSTESSNKSQIEFAFYVTENNFIPVFNITIYFQIADIPIFQIDKKLFEKILSLAEDSYDNPQLKRLNLQIYVVYFNVYFENFFVYIIISLLFIICVSNLIWFGIIIKYQNIVTLVHKNILLLINFIMITTALAVFYLIIRMSGDYEEIIKNQYLNIVVIYIIFIFELLVENFQNVILVLISFGWRITVNLRIKNLYNNNKRKIRIILLIFLVEITLKMINFKTDNEIVSAISAISLVLFYCLKIIFYDKIVRQTLSNIRYNNTIHLYFFDEYHRKANLYKVRFLRNFKFFNYIQNISVTLFELFYIIFNNLHDLNNNSNFEMKILLNLILINIFLLVMMLLFWPPKVHLLERYYLRKNNSLQVFCQYRVKIKRNMINEVCSYKNSMVTNITKAETKSIIDENFNLNDDFFRKNSFYSIKLNNIDNIREDYFKPFVVINPIFKKKDEIFLIDIIKNSSIGYLHVNV